MHFPFLKSSQHKTIHATHLSLLLKIAPKCHLQCSVMRLDFSCWLLHQFCVIHRESRYFCAAPNQ